MNVDAPRVLVLNAGFEPLGVASVKRAVLLVQAGHAEVVEESGEVLRTVSTTYPVPAIVRLKKMVRRPVRGIRLKRRNLIKRDGGRCQYCGRVSRELTVDHVIPRSRGGKTVWENVVAACRECNHKKADRTPEEAGMRLLTRPAAPASSVWLDILNLPPEWAVYFPGYARR